MSNPTELAMALARSRLEELTQRVQELEEALSKLAGEFARVYPIYYYAEPWAHDRNEVLNLAHSVLNKETSRA